MNYGLRSTPRWQTLLLLGAFGACGSSDDDAGPAWFEEVAASAGLTFTHSIGEERTYWFPEIMGGGCGLLDYDGDGDLDVYFVQSGELDPAAPRRPGNQLFRNRGDGTFEDVTAAAGVADQGYGMGCACGDYDADGDVDLYVTNVGHNVLYRNEGDGSFVDVTNAAGVGHPAWGTSAAFLDYDADGDLDLFVTNYVSWSKQNELECSGRAGQRVYCSPNNYNAPARDVLYRNDGDGTFADVTEAAGLGAAFGNGLGVSCGDLNLDGRIDIYVANDGTANQLWFNDGDGTFTEDALAAGCAFNMHGQAEAGMGVACVDFEHDGDLDLFMTHLRNETNTLYRNDGAGVFEDVTSSMGLGMPSVAYTGFGTGFADFDQDGHLDLYIANGRVVRAATSFRDDDPYAEPNLLLRGLGGGKFADVRPIGEIAEPLYGTSRAAAFGDVDGDGDVDMIVVESNGPARLLRNVATEGGKSLTLRVLDERGVDAIGAVVELESEAEPRFRLVQTAYSYLTSNDPRVHFGLRTAAGNRTVRVRWIDGSWESFGTVGPGGVHALRRGQGTPGR